MPLIFQVLLIGCGGALGALSRFGIAKWIESNSGLNFPLGTLLANALGCLLIGLLMGSGRAEESDAWRSFVGIGFLGALTTFSTFSAETHRHLTTEGELMIGLTNVGANVVVGLLAVACGAVIGTAYFRVEKG